MWLFTRDGFFSTVRTRFCAPGEVAVRARSREHLKAFMDVAGIKQEIVETPEADYRWRVQVPVAVWADYARDAAMSCAEYGNFKSEVAVELADDPKGEAFLGALHNVWAVMHQFQGKAGR